MEEKEPTSNVRELITSADNLNTKLSKTIKWYRAATIIMAVMASIFLYRSIQFYRIERQFEQRVMEVDEMITDVDEMLDKLETTLKLIQSDSVKSTNQSPARSEMSGS